VVETNKCSDIGEIHKAAIYKNARCKLTGRHFCSCAQWMTGRLRVLVERLIVNYPSNQLGEEESILLKLVVNTQGVHLDLVQLLLNRQWNFWLKYFEILYQMWNYQLLRMHTAACSEFESFKRYKTFFILHMHLSVGVI